MDHGQRAYEVFIDPATGLYDRRTMWSRLAEEVARAQRYSYPFSLMLVSLDSPDPQQAVEHVVLLAQLLQQHTRTSDILARYSEDALALILPCTDQGGALRLAERIQQMIPPAAPAGDVAGKGVMVSIGVTSTAGDYHGDKVALVEQVEQLLLQSRKQGGGRIIFVTAPGSSSKPAGTAA